MAGDFLVNYRAQDIKGALLQKSLEKSSDEELRRWIECRGLTWQKSEKRASLVSRYLLSTFAFVFMLHLFGVHLLSRNLKIDLLSYCSH